ncbi:hypothetical protein N7V53_16460 [Kosakonia sp. HypNH10]|uniref:putative T6SS immunity periplasmic lipoprotein n=1 Tax=Kosakonia sp. HypNH10 TaxID=2980101 RepID=UPI00244C5F80|nr:putative T6SS immunity periplasmic lipoprotein [Kosakonia sp. HypNH10]MDH2914116.1 hypothetical protein [Kosakonia sp. HypNH10]
MKNYYAFLPLLCLPLLSGCPMGDRVDQRYKPAETAPVMVKNAQVCFTIKDAEDYQPAFISIAPRTTPYKERWYQQAPRLAVKEGKMCIPPGLYKFPDRGEFITTFVLSSKAKAQTTAFNTRRFNVAFAIDAGHAKPIAVNDSEF